MSKYFDRALGFSEGASATSRPKGVTDEHLEYLDGLRESGATNMLGARPHLMDEFPELTEKKGSLILSYWMQSFGKPNR